jgi:hypothetical protein
MDITTACGFQSPRIFRSVTAMLSATRQRQRQMNRAGA